MSDEKHIKSSIKEAEVYRTQGLYEEARNKYLEVLRFVEESTKFSSQVKLIEGVKNRIQLLDKELAASDDEGAGPALPQDQRELIKRLFTFSQKDDARAVEGAVALAKFGQYEEALREFRRLLEEKTQAVAAAKNIMRCHLAVSSPGAAIEEFRQWLSGDVLSKGDLKSVRTFLVNLLEKQGVRGEVPRVVEPPSEKPQDEERQEEIIDICSVRLRLEGDSGKGRMFEFDVTFQSGSVISFIVSAKQQDVVEKLNVGVRLADMEFYSPIAIFRGSGVVSGKTKIRSGPKKGAYMLDINLEP
jgi:tetratricopeptide (TPR) repeat protein